MENKNQTHYEVKDLSLADEGKRRIEWDERAMPVLRIHLGCGPIDDPRFLNVDARAFPHVHYVTKSPLMPALPSGRADMIYACHMFEHVGEARLPQRIVHRARIHIGVKGDHRCFVALANDKMQAVGKREFGDFLFELLQALCARHERKDKNPQDVFEHAYTYLTLS